MNPPLAVGCDRIVSVDQMACDMKEVLRERSRANVRSRGVDLPHAQQSGMVKEMVEVVKQRTGEQATLPVPDRFHCLGCEQRPCSCVPQKSE